MYVAQNLGWILGLLFFRWFLFTRMFQNGDEHHHEESPYLYGNDFRVTFFWKRCGRWQIAKTSEGPWQVLLALEVVELEILQVVLYSVVLMIEHARSIYVLLGLSVYRTVNRWDLLKCFWKTIPLLICSCLTKNFAKIALFWSYQLVCLVLSWKDD